MNQTDRIISNIGAIKTMIENFPMNIFDKNGKTYESAFDFLMEIIRNCGYDEQFILFYIVEKIYGFSEDNGYTINGLYDKIKRNSLKIEQNEF